MNNENTYFKLFSADELSAARNKANSILYATALEWPDKTLRIKKLATVDLSGLKNVPLLGTRKKLKWRQTAEGLEITMPDKPEYDYAYPVKLVFDGDIPHPFGN